MREDTPLSQELMKAISVNNLSGYLAYIRKQAVAGDVMSELLLGTMYIPPECTFQPYKNAPKHCPHEFQPKNAIGLVPSFEEAARWLQLASGQGNGEASEVFAEMIDRAIRSPEPTHWNASDVAQYHALARSQGFDVQDVQITCYFLSSRQPADTLIMSSDPSPAEFQLPPELLIALHDAGASGTVRWEKADEPQTMLLRHPEGPKVHVRVVLSGPIQHEILIPLPDRTDVMYLQLQDRVVTIPASYPVTARVLKLQPPTGEKLGGAAFQGVDGTFFIECGVPAKP